MSDSTTATEAPEPSTDPAAIAAAGHLGEPFPDGRLLDPHGSHTTFAATVAGRSAVVVFYRGSWCPFCNTVLHAYQEQLLPGLQERGVALVAISPEKPDGSLTVVEKHGLEYAVLSDPGNAIASALGILNHPSDEALQMQRSHGVDLTEVNADATTTIVHPAAAIVDAAGVLRWVDVHEDHRVRTDADAILAALDDVIG